MLKGVAPEMHGFAQEVQGFAQQMQGFAQGMQGFAQSRTWIHAARSLGVRTRGQLPSSCTLR